MAKSPKKPTKKPPEVELVPDAWGKFERFIKRVAKAGPQHRTKTKPSKRPKSKPE